MIRRSTLSAAFALAAASQTFAQTSCINWDNLGNPGFGGGGEVAAFGFYDGNVFAGGRFTSVGGMSGTGFLAQYSPTAAAWSGVGGGINQGPSNAVVWAMANFDFGKGENLVVGGFFFNAGGVSGTRSLARWDGSQWAAFGTGFGNTAINESVWDLLVTDAIGGENRLYAVGHYPAIGGNPCAGIAYYHKGTWTPMNTSMGPPNDNPTALDVEVFRNEIYVAGTFTTIDGQDTNLAAKWTGSSWVKIGPGILSNFPSEIATMCVYDDGTGPALYLGGRNLRVGASAACNVLKWDGTSLTTLGPALGGTVWDLFAFDDGAGTTLYAGCAGSTVSFLVRREGSLWASAFGGVNGSVYTATTQAGRAYIGGTFTAVGAPPEAARRIAVLERCNADCPADFDNDGFITGADYDGFVVAFEAGTTRADFDYDGFVTGIDFDMYVAAYEAGC